MRQQSPDADQATSRARRFLRRKQADWAGRVPSPGSPGAWDIARERVAFREASSAKADGFVWDGAFKYPLERERVRWSRTNAIIDRTQPGPHEDGTYLEFLARQAASVELTLEGLDPDGPIRDCLDRIVFGTTAEPTSQATTWWLEGASAVALSAGMVYAMYQAAKAVVLSWKPVPRKDGRGGGVAFSALTEDTRAVLDADDAPVRLLADTLLSWLYTGRARPADSQAPPPIYHPPLALLTAGAERFVIAHEYGHALIDQFAVPIPWIADASDLPEMAVELRADAFATIVVAESAGVWDSMAPNMLLQGAILAMKIHEIADRALDLALGGDGDPEWGSETHPPFDLRASQVIEVYRAFVSRVEDDRLDVRPLFVPAETADLLWERARSVVERTLAQGRPLHPMWSAR